MNQAETRVDAMERLKVKRWRFEQFVELGFTESDSVTLAAAAVDIGLVRRLIGAGCPPDMASRIVL